jgi:uncharacterized protein (DUF885 family)
MVACSSAPPPKPAAVSFDPIAGEFVYGTLALSPVSATGAGYHTHQSVRLDEQLDDYSAAGIEKQRQFYTSFRDRLGKDVRADELSAEDRADFDIVSDQIALGLLELDRIQSYKHNPTLYVELLGNALFNPFVLEYAPQPERMRHIIARIEKIPAFLEQAKGNLISAPEIWTTVAVDENAGNVELIDKDIRAAVPADMKDAYAKAAQPAVAALKSFQDYLKKDLAKKNSADWRIGKELYDAKFRYVLATDRKPEQVLADAEADVKTVRARMLELSKPLYKKYYPGKTEPADPGQVIKDTLARIAERHSTPATYMADAKRDLEEARQFVKSKGLLQLPPRDNLQVIETPVFMRGIYSVGGFNSAPALEPQLGAFYWLTPIPKDWPAQRVESKLREYNFYKLKLLTIHEAMPGHYVQLEYANDVQPKSRRVLRSVFGNGPYVEGWGQYSTQMMLDEGYLDNAPELRLTFQKEELRVLANAILDVKLQTLGMTDQQALDLMMGETFQEKEEATGKLRRAKLSSCQLPMYLVGWRDWIRVREDYKQRQGAGYKLAAFNEASLKEGAVPLPVLKRLLSK